MVANRPGAVDLNVYEVNFGGPVFEFLDVRASADGVFGRSYDLGALPRARFVRLVGIGNGDAGGTNYFDLDALGAHELALSPVPEPQAWLIRAAGLGTLGLWRRRHGRGLVRWSGRV